MPTTPRMRIRHSGAQTGGCGASSVSPRRFFIFSYSVLMRCSSQFVAVRPSAPANAFSISRVSSVTLKFRGTFFLWDDICFASCRKGMLSDGRSSRRLRPWREGLNAISADYLE